MITRRPMNGTLAGSDNPGGADVAVCPHWQRPTPDGRCIDKWWAGPPFTWLAGGVAFALGGAMVALGSRFVSRADDRRAGRHPGTPNLAKDIRS